MNQGNKGPYSFGKKVYNHRGHTVTSIVNSPEFDNLIQNIQNGLI